MANPTVIISNGRITVIGPDQEAAIPEGARRIPLAGKALLPGWIMLHEHLFHSPTWKDPLIVTEQPIGFPKLYPAAGVTSARMSDESISGVVFVQFKVNVSRLSPAD